MPKTKKIKKKNYIHLAKENPHNAFFDMLNLALVIFVLGVVFGFLVWISYAFKGDIKIDPVAININGWNIYWYGIVFAIAFLLGLMLVLKESRRFKYNPDFIINMIFGATISGFVGARLVFALLNWSYYSNNIIQIFNIWQGGLSLHGAILGGLLFIAIYSKIKKINVWQILDIFSPAILLGTIIGRWGNFFNQELFGYPSKSFLKMYISPLNRPYSFRGHAYFHPVFLYESLLCLVALIVLLIIRRRKSIRTGEVFLAYIALYSSIRFFIEFIRIEPKIFLSLTLAQIVSLLIFIASLGIIFIKRKAKSLKKVKKKKGKK